MRDILQSYSVNELKKEISKQNIKGYSKMKKAEIINLMMKHKDKFTYLKKKETKKKEQPKKKEEQKPEPKKVMKKKEEPKKVMKKKEEPKKEMKKKEEPKKKDEKLSDIMKELENIEDKVFDKKFDLKNLKKIIKNPRDIVKVNDELVKIQKSRFPIQSKLKTQNIQKQLKEDRDTLNTLLVNKQQYERRLKLIMKNLRKINEDIIDKELSKSK